MSFFTLDSLSILMLIVLAIVLVPVVIHSFIYFRDYKTKRGSKIIFFSALLMLTVALALGYMSNHITMTWVFTEITTLAAGLLIYHHREELALEAVWKYVFVCAISVTFIFIGILFWGLALLQLDLHELTYDNLMSYAPYMDPFWLKMGYVFIFAGFTVKMGLFPMFTAGIDAKDNAPGPAAAMLSSVLVNLGFVGIYRCYAVMVASSEAQWARIMMLVAAVLTIFIATTYIVKVHNIKRLLAYSCIEHSAIVIIGLCFGRVGTIAALLHIIMHSFIKSGLFLHYGQLAKVYKSKMIEDMGDYFNINPFGALVLLLGLFSITAIPPSGLFMSELQLFGAMLAEGSWLLMAIVALLLTVLIWAICKIVISIVFLPRPKSFQPHRFKSFAVENITQLVLFLLAIYIGYFNPSYVYSLIGDAASLLF